MIKLLALDVDNTLAKLNEGVPQEVIKQLDVMMSRGVEVMLISGKPSSYLAGMARQMGLTPLLLAGENGIAVNVGQQYPPQKVFNLEISDVQIACLADIKKNLASAFGKELWFQPNEVQIAAFHYDNPELRARLEKHVETLFMNPDYMRELKYYIHADCVDILPIQVSKGSCLEMYLHEKGVKKDEVITVGDGVNDVSMFNVSQTSIGIGESTVINPTLRFSNIVDALTHIKVNFIG